MIELVMRVGFSVTGSTVVRTSSVVVVDAVIIVDEVKIVRGEIMALKSAVVEVSARGASVMLYTLPVDIVLIIGVVVLKSEVFILLVF